MIDRPLCRHWSLWLDGLRWALSESFIVLFLPLRFPLGFHSRVRRLILQLIQQTLHLLEPPIQVRRLECPELQIQKWRQTGGDSGMKLARVDVRDQLLHSILHRTYLVKAGQRIVDLGPPDESLFLPPIRPSSAALFGLA